jgi:four helix bundle protein
MPEAGGSRDIQDRAFRFACRVVAACERLIRRGGVAALIARQLTHAGTSIGANLEEACGAQSRADFIAKVSIALKEARETRYWLRLVVATQPPAPADADELSRESDELVAILTTILRNARSKGTESRGDEREQRS